MTSKKTMTVKNFSKLNSQSLTLKNPQGTVKALLVSFQKFEVL